MHGAIVMSKEHSLPALEGVGSYVWHVADDVLEWSPGLVALYGLELAPTDEAAFNALLHPEDRLRVQSETTAFLEHATHFSHEFRIIRPDGIVRHILDRAKVERSPDGSVVAIRGVNVDITDERLADPFVGFRALADNINQLAWIADQHGSIYWYNARWY
ncbi:MAG: PAS domain-containing protein [Rhizobiales bacterium]|nr:PAS domain-containing protein [Hyphomicrobiales bacterium]